MANVLVVSPVMRDHNGRGRLFVNALRSHLELEYNGALDWYQVIGGDNFASAGETVTRKYNQARDVFLAGNWSHMLALETDMIVPRDTISRLLALEADIAYGLYAFRHTGQQKWSAASSLTHDGWKSFSENEVLVSKQWGQVASVAGVGMGCTLIQRHVLETTPFHYWKGVNCDWALACDAQAAGWSQRCDLGLICGHMTLTPSPRTLWPDVNAENFVRIEYPE